MSSHPPAVHTPNQARDEQRREEAKREEFERKSIEDELLSFDSHEFYSQLQEWAEKAVPQPQHNPAKIYWLKRKQSDFQPVPVPRLEFAAVHVLSTKTLRLLSLLRSAEQKGIGCPYVHQVNKEILEKAIEKCKEIQKAIVRCHSHSSAVGRLLYLLHRGYLSTLSTEIERFLSRLEAIFLICRHEEFAQDLMRLRRAVTYRTGYVLGTEEAPLANPMSPLNKKSKK